MPISYSKRFNLCIIKCKSESLFELITTLTNNSIKDFNSGKAIAAELSGKRLNHLSIKVQEFINQFTIGNEIELASGKPQIVSL